jgi:RimJ/RimL family protein N-acetyltransferase
MTHDVRLRDVAQDDLPIFFEHQRDPVANAMAAFPARDREAFMAHWAKIPTDETAVVKTILFDGYVAGNVVSWEQDGKRQVGYWIGKEYWGKGVATKALSEFLRLLETRPLYAHVAKHNAASLLVLQKCGFMITGEAAVSSQDSGDVIEEFILQLGAAECSESTLVL